MTPIINTVSRNFRQELPFTPKAWIEYWHDPKHRLRRLDMDHLWYEMLKFEPVDDETRIIISNFTHYSDAIVEIPDPEILSRYTPFTPLASVRNRRVHISFRTVQCHLAFAIVRLRVGFNREHNVLVLGDVNIQDMLNPLFTRAFNFGRPINDPPDWIR